MKIPGHDACFPLSYRMGEGEWSSVGRRIQPLWKLRATGLAFPSPVGRKRVRVRVVFSEIRLLSGTCFCASPCGRFLSAELHSISISRNRRKPRRFLRSADSLVRALLYRSFGLADKAVRAPLVAAPPRCAVSRICNPQTSASSDASCKSNRLPTASRRYSGLEICARAWRRCLHGCCFNVDEQTISPLVACASCPRRVCGA